MAIHKSVYGLDWWSLQNSRICRRNASLSPNEAKATDLKEKMEIGSILNNQHSQSCSSGTMESLSTTCSTPSNTLNAALKPNPPKTHVTVVFTYQTPTLFPKVLTHAETTFPSSTMTCSSSLFSVSPYSSRFHVDIRATFASISNTLMRRW